MRFVIIPEIILPLCIPFVCFSVFMMFEMGKRF